MTAADSETRFARPRASCVHNAARRGGSFRYGARVLLLARYKTRLCRLGLGPNTYRPILSMQKGRWADYDRLADTAFRLVGIAFVRVLRWLFAAIASAR